MKTISIDASIIIKWFVEEEYSDIALKIRDDYVDQEIDIVIPELAYYEVLNALRYSNVFGMDELKKIGETLEDYQFLRISLRGMYLQKTVERALKHGVTIYDAAYIAIGDVRGCEVYTADEKLLAKMEGLPYIKHLKHYK
jgi:predicted nucleic acid-binding protein